MGSVKTIVEITPERLSIIESQIEVLLSIHGKLEQQQIIDAARDPQNPLHDIFEWDDTKAASEHRLLQARQLIRVIVLRPLEGSASSKFRMVGSGRHIQIVRTDPGGTRRGRPRSISVIREPVRLPSSEVEKGLVPVHENGEVQPTKEISNRMINTDLALSVINSQPDISPDEDDDEETGLTETSQKIRNEIIALTNCKSRLVKIPEAIETAKIIKSAIMDLEGLLGRLGKNCARCGLRNHTAGDEKHECLTGSSYTGTSNLGRAGQ